MSIINVLLLLVATLAAAADEARESEVSVWSGFEVDELLESIDRVPGPPVTCIVRKNISLSDVGREAPVRIVRNITLRGAAGDAQLTELSLDGRAGAVQLADGVSITLENLTLSNLAPRPPAQSPPPVNYSVFTFPLWFFEASRCACPCALSVCMQKMCAAQ